VPEQRLVKSGNTFEPTVTEVKALSVKASSSLAGVCGMVAPRAALSWRVLSWRVLSW